ncbi:hypothetical protein HAX54_005108 [Datura stramonium]|uniref:Uncharacterized protein n=1 Tax=Datura stramonium TaxID=4076 RepID=A0ABS8T854_DATST|nr:hypothetical protein [Datura stramonium]
MEVESSNPAENSRSYNVADCKYARRPKRPIIKLDSMTLQDLAVSADMARHKVFLNITMNGSLSIKNPNR